MRVAVLSDLHSNLPALDAVLDALGPVDATWVLGDIVGYGPEPDAVVERLAALDVVAVQGNHDAAALGQLDPATFNDDARAAVIWTGRQLGSDARAWLDALPYRRTEGAFTLVHGSPRDPLWEYLYTVPVARRSFKAFETRHCLVGHTHVPLAFTMRGDRVEILDRTDGSRLELGDGRSILNPGGVGQPRDGDARACAMVLDTDSGVAEWHRVAYPVERTQERMRVAGLPTRLINRLQHGL